MTTRRAAIAAAIAVSALAAGCASKNPLELFGLAAKPAHPPTPLTPITSQVTPTVVWTAPVGKSGGYAFRPDAEGGRIYAASSESAMPPAAGIMDSIADPSVARRPTIARCTSTWCRSAARVRPRPCR